MAGLAEAVHAVDVVKPPAPVVIIRCGRVIGTTWMAFEKKYFLGETKPHWPVPAIWKGK